MRGMHCGTAGGIWHLEGTQRRGFRFFGARGTQDIAFPAIASLVGQKGNRLFFHGRVCEPRGTFRTVGTGAWIADWGEGFRGTDGRRVSPHNV
jgi:hypothetical protein